ncbi:MAG: epoxyqueuosine reductase [Dehalococcoidales bacterium]|nr:epoxyqueuosine reductase [Dehalococcoidales bacterium]
MSQELLEYLYSKGAVKVGFAGLSEILPGIRFSLPYGISIAVALDPWIISGIRNGPNAVYFKEYQRANALLDTIGNSAVEFLKERGYKAGYLAATNTGIDWETLSTSLPHKTVATRAGMGWIGKSALLVTEEFGPAVRITSVFTDMPLPAAEPVNVSRCGDCMECVNACPGHALTGNTWSPGNTRDSLYDAFSCVRTSQQFEKTIEGLSENVCGICIAACPWTRRYIEGNNR